MIRTEIGYRRLLNQLVAGGRLDKPGDVVRRLGAMQAQDYHQVMWAIGSRTTNACLADIEQSIAGREIVLTWSMRGTIHAVPSDEVRGMLQLLTPRILAGDKRRLEQLELTPDVIARSKEILYRVLHGNRPITRPDLMQAFEDSGIRTNGQRGYHLLWHHAQTGLICLGPREGKQQTFVLLDDWVPKSLYPTMSSEETLTRLTASYFTSHGPATVNDYAWWTGLMLADARRGLELVRERLASATVGDQIYWFSPSSPGSGDVEAHPSVYLLPGFDEYILGYKNRMDVLREEHAKYIVPGNNGMFMPTIVVDGQVAGTWKRNVKKRGMDIELYLFRAQEDRENELKTASLRYSEFMELPLTSIKTRTIDE